MNIGQKLREVRKNLGYTQEEISQQVHVSRQTISSWENSKSLPDVMSLILLSDIYNLSLDELIKGDQDMINEISKKEQQIKAGQFLSKIKLGTTIGIVASVLLYILDSLTRFNGQTFIIPILILTLILNAVPYQTSGQDTDFITDSKVKMKKTATLIAVGIIVGFIMAFVVSKFL